jgi:hypothetical protein
VVNSLVILDNRPKITQRYEWELLDYLLADALFLLAALKRHCRSTKWDLLATSSDAMIFLGLCTRTGTYRYSTAVTPVTLSCRKPIIFKNVFQIVAGHPICHGIKKTLDGMF